MRERRRAELDGESVATAAATWEELELALVRVVDITSVATEPEREELQRRVPGAELIVLPMANALAERVPGPHGRSGLLFVGNFEHMPNVDAVKWLANDIMPLLRRRLGDVKLTVVGNDPPPEVRALERGDVESRAGSKT